MTDDTVSLLARGYAWLPDLLRRHGGSPVRTRLLGRPALVLHGHEAVDFFYDERHVRRGGALPGPVLDTLFGRGAVHTLDGDRHRVRKDMFVSLMSEGNVAALTDRVSTQWLLAVEGWRGREVVLFDEISAVLAAAVCDWAGLGLPPEAARNTAADCVSMVDGFATVGPRHFRARAARTRQEKALARTVKAVRAGNGPEGGVFAITRLHDLPRSVLETIAWHKESDGRLLDARTAAVELLNVVRPTVALAWYGVFCAHALHRDPVHRERLRADDGTYARAFAHEVRRFYPFAPFVAGLAVHDLEWRGAPLPEGGLVLLDLYGHDHDPDLWPEPYRFDPQRFLDREPTADGIIPQGGGDARTGHRCPGEDTAVSITAALATALAHLDYEVPDQDLRIPLHRMPTRPRSGFVVAKARMPVRR